MRLTKAMNALLTEMRKGRIESKKQQDYLFKQLNADYQGLKGEMIHDNLLDTFNDYGPFKISPEQTKQGLDWLLKQWKTPAGRFRKNNPFGNRETYVLEHFKYFLLVDIYTTFSGYKLPVYTVVAEDGMSFDYYMVEGRIVICG